MPTENRPRNARLGGGRVSAMAAVVDPRLFVPTDYFVLQSFRDGYARSQPVAFKHEDPHDLIANLESAVRQIMADSGLPDDSELGTLTYHCNRLRSFVDSGDSHRAAIAGVQVGMLSQWLALRPFDASTRAGLKMQHGQDESQRSRTEVSLKRSADIVNRWRAIDSQGTYKTRHIDEVVAQEFACSPSTVRIARAKAGIRRR